MAKSGNWKWCVLVVVVLVLFARYRQRSVAHRSRAPEATTAVEAGVEISSDLYTAAAVPDTDIPVIDELEMEESVEAQIPETAQVHIPMMELEAAELESPNLNYSQSPDNKIDEMPRPDRVVVLPAEPPQRIPGFVEEMPADQLSPAPESRSVAKSTPAKQFAGPFNLPKGVQIAAEEHIEYGKSLARRGAVYGAKQEFLAALRLVAQAKDEHFKTTENSERLFAALTAFKEADDFYFAQSENNGHVDVKRLVLRHHSRVLTADECATLTPMAAMQAYYQFVQQRLFECSGNKTAGEALYCLGKVHSLNASNSEAGGTRLNQARSLVFHDAALQCDPQNYKSANELGVLMAKAGRLPQAKQLFLQSLQTRQLPKVWANLAEVHSQLGEQKLAQLAEAEYQRMLDAPSQEQTASIQWKSPEEFAQDSKATVDLRTAQRPAQNSQTQDGKSKQSSIKNIFKRFF